MNGKTILLLTISLFFTSFFNYHFLYKKQSLEVKSEEEEEEEEEEEVKSEEEQQKENEETSVPWLLTWKGEVLSLSISIVIYISSKLFFRKNIEKVRNSSPMIQKNTFIFLKNFTVNSLPLPAILIFEVLISPLLFAFKKFRKEKYHQRLKRMFSIFKITIISIIIFFLLINFYIFYSSNKRAKKVLLRFFASAFKCCEQKNNNFAKQNASKSEYKMQEIPEFSDNVTNPIHNEKKKKKVKINDKVDIIEIESFKEIY